MNDPWTNQQIGYNYKVIGTTFTATCDNKPNNQPCGSVVIQEDAEDCFNWNMEIVARDFSGFNASILN